MEEIKREKKVPVHYVNNRKFHEAIVKYYSDIEEARSTGKPEPKMPDYIGECIWKIALRLSSRACFANYSYKEEMISDGIENSIMYFKSYDINKGNNPFAYFTQVIKNAFRRRINKEEKNKYTKFKYLIEHKDSLYDLNLMVDENDNHLITTKVHDNMNDFIANFERKEAEKKAERKIAKETGIPKPKSKDILR